ncbi:MAG: D-tyrosyl-tRNA(Tyr) deacylase [Bacteroidetes bacterium HGW-Bacteroidetes-12]|nr:MAG: D-tyrosyl-tRNA(Tyr) deacylase [Bacteroidetes bacterium HGW-Bacteroidetes-12]
MKAVIQRVSEASVSIESNTTSIGKGLLILLGVAEDDTQEDITWLAKKIAQLRIFDDNNNIPNLSVNDINGEVLLISQFTIMASTKKGNRPSFIMAAKPPKAVDLYTNFIKELTPLLQQSLKTGKFGAYMKVALVNEGPFTIIIDSKNRV